MNIYISLLITMAFSAFFSGMEIAFVSVDKLRFEMERKGRVTSRILSVFFQAPERIYLYHAGRKQYSIGYLWYIDGTDYRR
jgi:CBS domain containing-hemolysin-like protein